MWQCPHWAVTSFVLISAPCQWTAPLNCKQLHVRKIKSAGLWDNQPASGKLPREYEDNRLFTNEENIMVGSVHPSCSWYYCLFHGWLPAILGHRLSLPAGTDPWHKSNVGIQRNIRTWLTVEGHRDGNHLVDTLQRLFPIPLQRVQTLIVSLEPSYSRFKDNRHNPGLKTSDTEVLII